MAHPLIKTTAVAFVFTLGLVAPALAVPALPLEGGKIVIPVIDEETAIEESLEPDVMPPGPQGSGATGGVVSEQKAVEEHLEPDVMPPGPQQSEPSAGGGDGSASEIPALQEAFPSTNWPESDRKKE